MLNIILYIKKLHREGFNERQYIQIAESSKKLNPTGNQKGADAALWFVAHTTFFNINTIIICLLYTLKHRFQKHF